MARSEYGVSYKNLYSYRLNKLLGNDYFVINKAKRTNTIEIQTNIQNIYDDVLTTDSNIFVIHLGIVDCAPRIISLMEGKILKYFRPKFLSNFYINVKSKNRRFFTKHFPKVYVKPQEFKKKYEFLINTIIQKTNNEKIILINIADTNEGNKLKSFGFDENIRKYNTVIKNLKNRYNKNIELIDFYTLTKNNPSLLLEDGIHISNEAHNILAEEISKRIYLKNNQ